MATRRTLLQTWLGLRCPRCRQGKLFTHKNPYDLVHVNEMHTACPVCQQPYSLEPGFYFGASYVSYGLNIALFIGTFIVLFFGFHIGFSLKIGISMVVMAVLITPPLFRLSRAMWLSFFVRYEKDLGR